MRLLSRLLSVMLALILLATGFLTASAGTDEVTADDVKKYARITITRTDDNDAVHPNTKLKFTIIVERLIDGHAIMAGSSANLTGPASNLATDDDTVGVLNDENPYRSFDVEYTVTTGDLGTGVASRTVPLKWTYSFQIADEADGTSNPHPNAAVNIDATINVDVTKRPGAATGDSEMSVVFGVTEPDEIAKGKEVKFTLTATTGKYAFTGGPVIIKKQLKDADGEKVGNALPVAVVTLTALGTNAVGDAVKSNPEAYKLLQSEVDALGDGGTLEFTYELQLTETNLGAKDVNGDGDTVDDVEKLTETYVLGDTPAPEPTAVPPIGMNSAATVTQGSGNLIHVALADGSEFSLIVGWVAADGTTRTYQTDGYIREEGSGRGQTYAVVRRDVDDKVVRMWIPSGSSYVNDVPWADVLANRTFDTMVVEAIPLDELYPVNGQLARNSGDDRIYVYTGAQWRHIPDVPTFQAWGFYWCDVTAADQEFFDRVTVGSPLPRSGTQEDPNYPVCR